MPYDSPEDRQAALDRLTGQFGPAPQAPAVNESTRAPAGSSSGFERRDGKYYDTETGREIKPPQRGADGSYVGTTGHAKNTRVVIGGIPYFTDSSGTIKPPTSRNMRMQEDPAYREERFEWLAGRRGTDVETERALWSERNPGMEQTQPISQFDDGRGGYQPNYQTSPNFQVSDGYRMPQSPGVDPQAQYYQTSPNFQVSDGYYNLPQNGGGFLGGRDYMRPPGNQFGSQQRYQPPGNAYGKGGQGRMPPWMGQSQPNYQTSPNFQVSDGYYQQPQYGGGKGGQGQGQPQGGAYGQRMGNSIGAMQGNQGQQFGGGKGGQPQQYQQQQQSYGYNRQPMGGKGGGSGYGGRQVGQNNMGGKGGYG